MPEAVDMINLGFLSESERELILEVLRRDEKLRQAEDQRVRKLKTELQDVKRKGAKRASEKYSQHSCGRCLEPLSRLTVFSSQCKMCNHIVCRNCRMVLPDGSWLCNVCAKESASLESKEEEELKVQSNSNRSDTESVESSSIASVKTETESGRVTPEPEQPR
uniref:RabBD domain-containing protein n=1 Tax=Pundamilia nyererei TaxID=303518 RepID=A0A3B4FU89_9CICH